MIDPHTRLAEYLQHMDFARMYAIKAEDIAQRPDIGMHREELRASANHSRHTAEEAVRRAKRIMLELEAADA